tara:strand:+ start:1079 stop:1336 length:258 start_codon:yes stop_codon:yes gene_type:complete
MKDQNNTSKQNFQLMIDSSIYFVATHYKISIPDVLSMSPDEFEQSFTWAAASKMVESDEIDKANAEIKGGTRVGSTSAGEPFPYE